MKKRLIGVVLAGILAISSVLPVCAEETDNIGPVEFITIDDETEMIEEVESGNTMMPYVQSYGVNAMNNYDLTCKNVEVSYQLYKAFENTGTRKFKYVVNGETYESFEVETNNKNWKQFSFTCNLHASADKYWFCVKNGPNTFQLFVDDELFFTLKYNVKLGNKKYSYNGSEAIAVEAVDRPYIVIDYHGFHYDNEDTDNHDKDSSLPFKDVPKDAWYYNAVKHVYNNKVMSGTSATSFSPNAPTTREMMVTILYNSFGKPATEYSGMFADVPNGKWFSTAVSWAINNGITSGKSDNIFGVGENVTREQVAVFIYNAAKAESMDVSEQADLSKYSDSALVSSWAKTAMSWVNSKGIINGSNGKLNPKGNATRAEIAQMMMQYSSLWR